MAVGDLSRARLVGVAAAVVALTGILAAATGAGDDDIVRAQAPSTVPESTTSTAVEPADEPTVAVTAPADESTGATSEAPTSTATVPPPTAAASSPSTTIAPRPSPTAPPPPPPSTSPSTSPPPPPPPPAGPTRDAGCEDVLRRGTNQYRQSNGRSALSFDTGFEHVPVDWTERMARDQRMAHNPNYAQQMAASTPGLRAWSENVGFASSADALLANWFASSGHRANILADMSHLEVGCWRATSGQFYATQNFARIG